MPSAIAAAVSPGTECDSQGAAGRSAGTRGRSLARGRMDAESRLSDICLTQPPTTASGLCAAPLTANTPARSTRRRRGWPRMAMPANRGRRCSAGGRVEHEILAAVVDNIPQERLEASCVVGDDAPVTLRFLIEDYVSHQRWHLSQIVGGITGT